MISFSMAYILSTNYLAIFSIPTLGRNPQSCDVSVFSYSLSIHRWETIWLSQNSQFYFLRFLRN